MTARPPYKPCDACSSQIGGSLNASITVPEYLEDTYWWAYTHPNAVRVFERQWLVNLILWGNFTRLRDWALDALTPHLSGRILQVAAVYGDFSQALLRRLHPSGHLSIIDVAPAQIRNLHSKLPPTPQVTVSQQDASELHFADASQDAVLLFFLLHEMPENVRRNTLAEALRVTRPGGQVVIVDYHRPNAWHPLRWLMHLVLRTLEPYALDLWRHPLTEWLPDQGRGLHLSQQTHFGGLYQMILITR